MSEETKSGKNWNPDIKKIGDQIVALTLMQAKELADYLKDEYGIEPAAGGPVMVAGPAAGGCRRKGRRTNQLRCYSQGSRREKNSGYKGSSCDYKSRTQRGKRPCRRGPKARKDRRQ